MTVLPANVGNGSAGNTLTFTYTAAAGGMAAGDVTVDRSGRLERAVDDAEPIPATRRRRPAPSRPPARRSPSAASRSRGGATMTIVYGSTAGGGPGATAGTTAGANVFQTQQRSTAGGVLTNIAASPSLNVYAADGSGTMTTPTANVVNGSSNTIVFTYKAAAAGGTSNGKRHAHRSRRLAGADGREHDVVARRAQLRRADGDRLGPDARCERDLHDHVRAGGGADDRRRADVVDVGGLDRRRHAHRARRLAVDQRLRAPTAPARSPRRRRPSATAPPATRRRSRTRRPPAGRATAASRVVVPAGWSAPSIMSGNAGYTVAEHGHASRSPGRRSPCPASRSPAARR